jgi:preprotein translocase subunit YajC
MEDTLFNNIGFLLALGGGAPPPNTQANPTGEMVKMLGTLLFMGAIFYFLLIRPQRMRARQLEGLLKSLKRGDKVVTGSGIIGIVISVQEKTVSIRSADTKLEILKSAVSEITERAGAESSS